MKITKNKYGEIIEDNNLRNLLDIQFYKFIRMIESGDTENVKELITDNILIKDNKVVNINSKQEFILPKGNYFFRQRYFGKVIKENITKFSSGYEIYPDKNYPNIDKIFILEVSFIFIEGEWKLNNIGIDGIDDIHKYK